jgi:hypothetical protein
VATHTQNTEFSLTTTGTELTEGKHYWEVEVLSTHTGSGWILIGISRPNLDPAGEYHDSDCTDGWFGEDRVGGYKQGDRVGMLLDLDNGSLRFFKNGVELGPGYPAGSVTGPAVAAVHMYFKDASVRLLPNAEAPANL